jgi:hypothetical protein
MADLATFTSIFPEFNSWVSTNGGGATFWLTQAQASLALGALGSNADLAVYLFMAHNIVLGQQDLQDQQAGDLPGGTLGPISSKSVGPVSVSYDTSGLADPKARAYNATSYGQRLWALLTAAAMGGVYAAKPNRPHVYNVIRTWP